MADFRFLLFLQAFHSLLELCAFGALTPFPALRAFKLRQSMPAESYCKVLVSFTLVFRKICCPSFVSGECSRVPFAANRTRRYDAARENSFRIPAL
jgi:hypothetical protein